MGAKLDCCQANENGDCTMLAANHTRKSKYAGMSYDEHTSKPQQKCLNTQRLPTKSATTNQGSKCDGSGQKRTSNSNLLKMTKSRTKSERNLLLLPSFGQSVKELEVEASQALKSAGIKENYNFVQPTQAVRSKRGVPAFASLGRDYPIVTRNRATSFCEKDSHIIPVFASHRKNSGDAALLSSVESSPVLSQIKDKGSADHNCCEDCITFAASSIRQNEETRQHQDAISQIEEMSFGGDNSNDNSKNQSSLMLQKTNSTAEQSEMIASGIRESLAINLNAQLFESMDSKKGTWCFGYDFSEQNDYFDTQVIAANKCVRKSSHITDATAAETQSEGSGDDQN